MLVRPIIEVLGARRIRELSESVLDMSLDELAKFINAVYEDGKFVECHEPSGLPATWIASYVVERDKIVSAIANARRRGVKGLCFEWDLARAIRLAVGRAIHQEYAEWVEQNGGAAEVRIASEMDGVPVMGAVDVVFVDDDRVAVGEVKNKADKSATLQVSIYAYILEKELGEPLNAYVINTYTVNKVNYASRIPALTIAAKQLWQLLTTPEATR